MQYQRKSTIVKAVQFKTENGQKIKELLGNTYEIDSEFGLDKFVGYYEKYWITDCKSKCKENQEHISPKEQPIFLNQWLVIDGEILSVYSDEEFKSIFEAITPSTAT